MGVMFSWESDFWASGKGQYLGETAADKTCRGSPTDLHPLALGTDGAPCSPAYLLLLDTLAFQVDHQCMCIER